MTLGLGRGPLPVLLLVAAVGAQDGLGPAHAEPPDLGAHPPVVESIEVQLVRDEPRATRVFVRYAPDPRLPERLTLDLGGEPLVLQQVAGTPGLYTGVVPMDPQDLVDRQKRLDDLEHALGRPLVHPVFDGRTKLKDVPVPRLPIERFLAGEKVALAAEWVSPDEVDAARSLFVTDPAVVRDPARTFDPCTGQGTPMGKWTFGHLMQQLATAAGTTDAAAFTGTWLAQFGSPQPVNGWTVASRPNLGRALLDQWPRTSGGALDLARAPFRLLAIVNRIDLRENLGYGGGSAGEARFVFGAVTGAGAAATTTTTLSGTVARPCGRLQLTVIFEYGIRASGCGTLRQWARQWVDLASAANYNQALEAVTDQFTAGSNGLAQVRSNEIALATEDATKVQEWEMREFALRAGALAQGAVKRTPDSSRNRTTDLAAFVNGESLLILADLHVVPPTFPTTEPFLGGSARLELASFFWAGPTSGSIVSADTRHRFSLNTCNGCHARETGTTFTHVNPLADVGSPQLLSGFLKGTMVDPGGTTVPFTVTDPESGQVRTMADLDRRRTSLAAAAAPCLVVPFFKPLKMIH